jgi:general secretion pathway protein E
MDASHQWRERLAGEPFTRGPMRLSAPVGCGHCRQSGYSGRSTIAELLILDEPIRRLVCESAPDSTLAAAAKDSGMMTMYQCGMAKAWRGETTVDEVSRVTRMD